MIRTILVAATGDPGDAATFAAALTVARPFGAHLDVLHVRLDPITTGVAMAAEGAGVMAGLIEQLEADALQREARAQEGFTRFCGEAGLAVAAAPAAPGGPPSAEWHVETGEEPDWMAVYGRTSDLIVASRAADAALAGSTLEAVLLESGRPLLMSPEAGMPAAIERVAIAWKPRPQAARAVALAMPFLTRAAEILIVTVEERPDERAETDRLVRHLAWHGLAARAERLRPGPDGAAATLLSSLAGRTDLLVMGGYGHSRVREWVFGGFTQHVLADAALPLPVVMAH